jgi:hypothetical protein
MSAPGDHRGTTALAVALAVVLAVALAAVVVFATPAPARRVARRVARRPSLGGHAGPTPDGDGDEKDEDWGEDWDDDDAGLPVLPAPSLALPALSLAPPAPSLALPAPPAPVAPAAARTLPNPGGGDCLFHCFLQALDGAGSVASLRAAVADSLGEEQLGALKCIFAAAAAEGDRAVLADYNFMRGVETLEDLRARVRTSAYYGDELALTALEKHTGLGALVLIGASGRGAPLAPAARLDAHTGTDRYILLRLRDVHYQLVAVGDRRVFARDELPPALAAALPRPCA